MKQSDGGTPDWLDFLQARGEAAGAELALEDLREGDLVQVRTRHTVYSLRMREGREADLHTGRGDRPAGRVRINGCTFGASSTIKPGHLFCGGNLEFQFDGGRMVHLTTEIVELRWVRGVARGV